MPLSDLGAHVSLEKSWVSRAVDAMVERGLVTKQANPADARSWLVGLTAAGEHTVDELNRTLDEHAEALLCALSPRDRSTVEHSLRLLMSALHKDTAANCCLPAAPRNDARSCC